MGVRSNFIWNKKKVFHFRFRTHNSNQCQQNDFFYHNTKWYILFKEFNTHSNQWAEPISVHCTCTFLLVFQVQHFIYSFGLSYNYDYICKMWFKNEIINVNRSIQIRTSQMQNSFICVLNFVLYKGNWISNTGCICLSIVGP